MLRGMVRALLFLFFRIELRGQEYIDQAGDKVLIVINPASLLDPLLVSAMLPEGMTLAVDSRLAQKWWMRPIFMLADTILIDFSSPMSSRALVRALEQHKRCMVFHPSKFRADPAFMRVLEATGLIAQKAHATLLPIRIDGAAYSRFSYFRHKVRLKAFPKIILTALPPQALEGEEAGICAKERRHKKAVQLYRVMTELLYTSSNIDQNILQTFTDASAIYGKDYVIAEDQDRVTLTYGAMLVKLHALGRSMARYLEGEERVGFMLPSSLPGVVAFLGLHAVKKVPAMINFTAGATQVISGCNTVQLKTILTSKKFIKLGELEPLEKALANAGFRILYLEDVADAMPFVDKIKGAFAATFRICPKTSPDAPVAILFTSGTEGMPKAVFMSHRNVNANREQMLSIIDVDSGDRLFNCLPMFHTFGLGIGTLLPLVRGIKVFLYPSPLHYRIVPQLFYETLSTVIFGTDTFFAGYARYGQPYDFFNARYVIAGAEKLRDTTATSWKVKYGVTMLEGYGATETSPVISVNTPSNTREGSVGRLAPGMRLRIKPVEGVTDGGVLWVNGDNVMLGYMRASAPGILEPPADNGEPGWYDTGDIVTVDSEDFIFIKGRAKRFAKIGGEMVSLAAVESALQDLWPDIPLGVVAVPDSRKGEQLVLIIEKDEVTTGQIATFFASRSLSPLWVPKRIISVKQAPLLGTGKFDYITAKAMAS